MISLQLLHVIFVLSFFYHCGIVQIHHICKEYSILFCKEVYFSYNVLLRLVRLMCCTVYGVICKF